MCLSKTFLLFFMIMTGLFLFSCKNRDTQQRTILPAKLARVDHDTVYDHTDTVNNKPVGKGFYRSKTGILFELKRTGFGMENDSVWSAILFLDSTLVTDNYEDRRPLKDFLDVPSYADIQGTSFSKDKRFVYYSRATSDGSIRFLIINADPGSFEPLGGNWSWDRKNVYYENFIVEGVARSRFRVFGKQSDSATDGKHIYVSGERID